MEHPDTSPEISKTYDLRSCSSSIASSMDLVERAQGSESPTVSPLISKIRSLILKIQTDADNSISEESSKGISTIGKILTKIEIENRKLSRELLHSKDVCISLEQRYRNLKETNAILVDSLPKAADIVNVVKDTIINLFPATSSSGTSMPQQQETPTMSASTSDDANHQVTTKPPNTLEDDDHILIHKKSPVIKSKKPTSGKLILRTLQSTRVPSHAVVDYTRILSNRVVYVCASERDRDALFEDFMASEHRNQFLIIKDSPNLYKNILLSVPDMFEFEDIEKSIHYRYPVSSEEIKFLRKKPSRKPDHTDYTFLLPLDLSKSLIKNAGIPLGPYQYRLLPFTTVIRCFNCQQIGHNIRQCKFPTKICSVCSEQLTESNNHVNCQNSPKCVNCMLSNSANSTSYPIDHKSSDNLCYSYKLAYMKERNRLDDLFSLSKKVDPQDSQEKSSKLPLTQHVSQQHAQQIPDPTLTKDITDNQSQSSTSKGCQSAETSSTTQNVFQPSSMFHPAFPPWINPIFNPYFTPPLNQSLQQFQKHLQQVPPPLAPNLPKSSSNASSTSFVLDP